jgi:hypothetical protein
MLSSPFDFDGRWLILDNRRLALVNDIEMRRVVPLFVLDSNGVKKIVPSTIPDNEEIRRVDLVARAR